MLANIKNALAPEGRVAFVHYRAEEYMDTKTSFCVEDRMSIQEIMQTWTAAGFEPVERVDTLPMEHFFVFKVPAESEEKTQ